MGSGGPTIYSFRRISEMPEMSYDIWNSGGGGSIGVGYPHLLETGGVKICQNFETHVGSRGKKNHLEKKGRGPVALTKGGVWRRGALEKGEVEHNAQQKH